MAQGQGPARGDERAHLGHLDADLEGEAVLAGERGEPGRGDRTAVLGDADVERVARAVGHGRPGVRRGTDGLVQYHRQRALLAEAGQLPPRAPGERFLDVRGSGFVQGPGVTDGRLGGPAHIGVHHDRDPVAEAVPDRRDRADVPGDVGRGLGLHEVERAAGVEELLHVQTEVEHLGDRERGGGRAAHRAGAGAGDQLRARQAQAPAEQVEQRGLHQAVQVVAARQRVVRGRALVQQQGQEGGRVGGAQARGDGLQGQRPQGVGDQVGGLPRDVPPGSALPDARPAVDRQPQQEAVGGGAPVGRVVEADRHGQLDPVQLGRGGLRHCGPAPGAG